MRAIPAAVAALGVALPFAVVAPGEARAAEESHAPHGTKFGWVDVFATAYIGDGIRFNNPYRLSTVLGSQAESLSRTATYADLGAAALLGDPSSLAHGLALRVTLALEGVPQTVLTPSYVALRRWGPWALYGRAGLPVVLYPDTTYGFEAAAGGVWFARAGLGLTAELVGDLFYGAGTREVSTPAYPVLSTQAGIWVSWEAMP
jgi:hypothetical protein